MKKLLSLCFAALLAGSIMAADIVFSGEDFTGGVSGTGSAFSVTKNGVTVASDKAYGTGSELRVYAGGKLSVSAGSVKISKIAAEFTSKTKATFDDATPNATSWSIDAEKQLRISKLTVSIEGDKGDDEGGSIGGGDDEWEDMEMCSVTATGKWSFVQSVYAFYDDGSMDIELYTQEGWFTDEEGNLYGEGDGSVMFLNIYPTDMTDIAGTYTIADGTLDSYYSSAADYVGEDITEYEFTAGTVTIKKNSDETAYDLTYALTSDGKEIKGSVAGLCLIDNVTPVANTEVQTNAAKTIMNGMLVIDKGGVKYNAFGQRINK